jgi:hypothetical protein
MSTLARGSGQAVREVCREPQSLRQVVQWHAWPGRGRADAGKVVLYLWMPQRHDAVKVTVSLDEEDIAGIEVETELDAVVGCPGGGFASYAIMMYCYLQGISLSSRHMYHAASIIPQVLCCKYIICTAPGVMFTYASSCCVKGRRDRSVSVCGARMFVSYLAFYLAFEHGYTEASR